MIFITNYKGCIIASGPADTTLDCARALRFAALFYHFMNQPSTSLPLLLHQHWWPHTVFEIIYETES